MRAMILGVVLALMAGTAFAGSHSVKGYVKSNGTYVAPTRATNPNSTRTDNYSSKPNVNPYNGKAGTKDPFAVKSPRHQ